MFSLNIAHVVQSVSIVVEKQKSFIDISELTYSEAEVVCQVIVIIAIIKWCSRKATGPSALPKG